MTPAEVVGFWTPGTPGFDIGDLGVYAGILLTVGGALTLLHRAFLKKPLARMKAYLDWNEQFRIDWEGSPVDDEKPWLPHTVGVLERLNDLDGEFHDDGNGSLKSSVRRTEALIRALCDQVERVETRQITIASHVESLQKRVTSLETRRPPAA
jgi:hypothetical protein